MPSEFNFHHKKKEFYKFLYNNYPVETSIKPTHTSIGDPPGSFNIKTEYQDYFYDYYSTTCFKYNIDLHLTERHNAVSPILIDLDFRYDTSDSERKFNIDFIKKIVKLYNKVIRSCYTNLSNELLESYILLKDETV